VSLSGAEKQFVVDLYFRPYGNDQKVGPSGKNGDYTTYIRRILSAITGNTIQGMYENLRSR
jgi:hypothetical protein